MRFTLLLVLLFSLCLAKPGIRLTRSIGKPGTFSANVTIESNDTTKFSYDSICSRYWYVKFNRSPTYHISEFYDYRIVILRSGSQTGRLMLFSKEYDYMSKDTLLTCGSLGFGPAQKYSYGDLIDTITSDTTVIYWIYPRPAKRAVNSPIRREMLSNHLKFALFSGGIRDSLVITRENVHFSSIIPQPGEIMPDGKTVQILPRGVDRRGIFDIRGRRVFDAEKTSQLVLLMPDKPAGGTALQKVVITGK